jgi:hypothetical protein
MISDVEELRLIAILLGNEEYIGAMLFILFLSRYALKSNDFELNRHHFFFVS